MTRRAISVAWLALVWLALWESPSWGRLVGGIAVALLATALVRPATGSGRVRVRPVATVVLSGYFLWKLVEASMIVAWEVVTPRDRTRPGVIAVPIETTNQAVMTVVANLVSLTPGTLTLEIDSATSTLFIHVLHLHSKQRTTVEVLHFERLVLAAFPPTANLGGAR